MNSKEALEHIIFVAKLDKPIFSVYYQELIEAKEKIEKDLEMANMIKNNISIQTDYDEETCKEYEYLAYNDLYLDIKNEEEYNKIKEWLENDK